MTRIIAGSARGRRLAVPARGTRPTSDRIRESLFSTLDSALAEEGRSWTEVVVLDLYAGTGALGLEALSRGAAAAYLVEADRSAVRTLRANVAEVGVPGAVVVARRVEQLVGDPPGPAADLVLVDPPYAVRAEAIAEVLAGLREREWIRADATVVVERPSRDDITPLPRGVELVRRRAYGDTALWYGRGEGEVLTDGEGEQG